MTNLRAVLLFLGVFALALITLLPLGVALRWAGADDAGLSARATDGDVWTGSLAQARLGIVTLGNARVGTRLLPLFGGRAEMGADTEIGYGFAHTSATTQGIRRVTAKLPLAATFAPLPVETLELAEATITFRGERCERAEGRVRATFAGSVAGLALAQGMSGIARCEAGELVLPLVSQSAMERLTVRLKGDGRWTALLAVQPADPARAAALASAGFRSEGPNAVLRLSGRF